MGEISIEKYIDKLIEAAEKGFKQRMDDMECAVKLAKDESRLAQRNAFWLAIVSLVGLVSGLLSLIIQYHNK
jgi:hypothetical protein